jgi:uncharacterized RDD family membrane protein YckC
MAGKAPRRELRVNAATVPNPPEADVPRAGLFRRLGAMFYDSLLLVAVLMGVTGAVIAAHGGPIDYHHFLYRGLLVVVTFIYFGGFWVHGGQTLGLRTWRLQVQRLDGGPITWPQALVRFAAAAPSLLLGGVGLLWILADRRNMAWHDHLSKSVIVQYPKISRS